MCVCVCVWLKQQRQCHSAIDRLLGACILDDDDDDAQAYISQEAQSKERKTCASPLPSFLPPLLGRRDSLLTQR